MEEPKLSEVHRLEDRVRAAEEHSEVLGAVRAQIHQLMAESVSLTTGTEQERQNMTPWPPIFASCNLVHRHAKERWVLLCGPCSHGKFLWQRQ